MTDEPTKVIDIRPDVRDYRVIDPPYIQNRIEQLLRECEAVELPCVVVMLVERAPYIDANRLAYDHWLETNTALECAKDNLRGLDGVKMYELDDDEGEPRA